MDLLQRYEKMIERRLERRKDPATTRHSLPPERRAAFAKEIQALRESYEQGLGKSKEASKGLGLSK